MDEQMAKEILDKLASKEISEYVVEKDEFLTIRKILVARPDFKHFRGIAQRDGHVQYTYLDEPRS